jgi:hypothetical protein
MRRLVEDGSGEWTLAPATPGAVCTRMAQDSRGSQQRYH